jgi:hypothetical protein
MQDLPTHGAPGAPVLPYKTVKVLIPKGMDLKSVNVVPSAKTLLKGNFALDFGKTPTPISSKATPVDKPNPEIYSSRNPFPGALYSQVSEQYLRGYKVAFITLHPVHYAPKIGHLFYYPALTVTISLKPTSEASPYLRHRPADETVVRQMVDNPEATQTYVAADSQFQPTSIINPSESYDYVIITNTNLNASFQPLIDWKTLKGLNATTVLVEDILSDPDYFCDGPFGDGYGPKLNDTAARVRNFIKDAYLNWGAEYVLLGGDVQVIPSRGVYGFVATDPVTIDRNIPCDMYFATLDGNWNNDNDTVFGEGVFSNPDSPENGTAGDEADLLAEVYVGRAPVTTTAQVENFVNKTLWYEQMTDDNYFMKAVMVGEKLDDETQGANSKDLVTNEIPQYTMTRLYQRDGTYSRTAVINAINSGTHILNHDGHTNPDIIMDLSKSDIDTLITNTEYFFGYSVGCSAAAIDGDSVIEHFVFNPQGAFAFVGNSRYGWYLPGTTYGVGDQFDRAFFNVLNNTVQNLGKTLQFSKESFATPLSNAARWTYFELNLLGDPETELVTEITTPTAHFQTNPSAENLSPPTLRGVVNLTGIAKRGAKAGAGFSNYTIEFYKGGMWRSDGISLTNNGQSEIVDDVIATWDTNILSPGSATLRLTVTDANGTTGHDEWRIRVAELPAIRALPELSDTHVGLTFTVSVKITDPEDLFGFDFQLHWNSTLVDYVSHSVYMPVEDYWWGVLYSPVTVIGDDVNETAGTHWMAAKSTSATPFERDGTVFNMTFQAIGNGTCYFEILSSNLTKNDDSPIVHKIVDGMVEIAPGIHDMAITDASPTGTVIGQGQMAQITVTLANEGTFPETFNVTAYANGTAIDTTQISLSALNSTLVTLGWDTTGWTKGNYSISVNVTIVAGETDTLDNAMIDGYIFITIAGDVDADADVDIFDIVRIAGAYGSKLGQPAYDGNCDIDCDGDVDIFDVVIAAGNYGEGT